eukprot:5445703-Prymnesium_polylepis.1
MTRSGLFLSLTHTATQPVTCSHAVWNAVLPPFPVHPGSVNVQQGVAEFSAAHPLLVVIHRLTHNISHADNFASSSCVLHSSFPLLAAHERGFTGLGAPQVERHIHSL